MQQILQNIKFTSNQPVRPTRCLLVAFIALFLAISALTLLANDQTETETGEFPLVTDLHQLRQVMMDKSGSIVRFDIKGTVLAVNSDMGIVVLHDETGAELLETTLTNWHIQPGQQIRLRGTNFGIYTPIGISLGKSPFIDNNGRHSKVEIPKDIFLQKGKYPIEVQWFNYTSSSYLSLDYSGPDFTRRAVPDSVLTRKLKPDIEGEEVTFHGGLDYRCYEGMWEHLPFFNTMRPVKSGICMNFDLALKTREENVALVFDGFINIDKTGMYRFYLSSDDGGLLYIANRNPRIDILGLGEEELPRPLDAIPGRLGDGESFWAQAEGTITFLARYKDHIELELESVTDQLPMRVWICDAGAETPWFLIGSRIAIRGICRSTHDLQMHRILDMVIAPSSADVQILSVPTANWTDIPSIAIAALKQCENTNVSKAVRLQGWLRAAGSDGMSSIQDKSGSVSVKMLNCSPLPSNAEVECLGTWRQDGTNAVLGWGVWRAQRAGLSGAGNLPELTTAVQIQQLSREEARRAYPVKLRGVVTWASSDKRSLVIQDATRGVSIGCSGNIINLLGSSTNEPPLMIGDILEVEGTTGSGDFSPIVIFTNATRIERGSLPAPKHPTFDELLNGSMDSQYVEIRGYVTDAHYHHITLLMFGGKIDVEFDPSPADDLSVFINSVVSIRGCMFAKWDPSLLITPEHPLWFGLSSICEEVPPPSNPFDVHQMHAKELMQFDARASIFQRIKVTGQVLAGFQDTYFCTDAGFGFRCKTAKTEEIKPGDMLEIAGLVELSSSSPIIREAFVRKTGQAPLPASQPFVFGGTNAIRDVSRVCVKGLLLDVKNDGSNQLLQLQSGMRPFTVLLMGPIHLAQQWKIGSTLQLTGVLSDINEREHAGIGNAIELLVNSPNDVVILAQPPWWTLKRLLTIAVILTSGLILTFVWISLLRHQVKRRTIELKMEINARQQIEQDRAIEQERSRIALDLHDDLGSRITAISMLAMPGQGRHLTAEASYERLTLIADKARQMVATLDGLVWVVDPVNDTVAALGEYLASYAEDFLARTGITFEIEMPHVFPNQTISAKARHNVLLAFREALNNAVRHGQPREVRLRMLVSDCQIQFQIQDNGCGFDPSLKTSGKGVFSLQERMRKVSGNCRIESSPGKGTTVFLSLSLVRPSVAVEP